MTKFNRCGRFDVQIDKRLIRALLDFLVLQEISVKPCHGYLLMKKIRQKYGCYFGPSTIYPLLEQMGNQGFLESSYVLDEDKPKKVCRITSKGQVQLKSYKMTLSLLSRLDKQLGVLFDAKLRTETFPPRSEVAIATK